MRVGEIISRIGDAVKIRIFINSVVLSLIVDILVVVFAFVFLFTRQWQLSFVLCTTFPLYGLMYALVNRFNK